MNTPPQTITLRWCDRCGRTNRHNSLRDKHYHNGTLCSGVIFDVVYMANGKVLDESA